MRIQLNPNKKQEVGRQFSNFKIPCKNTSQAASIDQYARPDINLCNYVRMGRKQASKHSGEWGKKEEQR